MFWSLGLIRRKPEIRYEKSLDDIKNLARIQLSILENISGLYSKWRVGFIQLARLALKKMRGR